MHPIPLIVSYCFIPYSVDFIKGIHNSYFSMMYRKSVLVVEISKILKEWHKEIKLRIFIFAQKRLPEKKKDYWTLMFRTCWCHSPHCCMGRCRRSWPGPSECMIWTVTGWSARLRWGTWWWRSTSSWVSTSEYHRWWLDSNNCVLLLSKALLMAL